jgi:hypothetical protein
MKKDKDKSIYCNEYSINCKRLKVKRKMSSSSKDLLIWLWFVEGNCYIMLCKVKKKNLNLNSIKN